MFDSKGLFTWSGGPRSSGVGFFLFSRSGGHKTKETYPTRPGSPTPCKQGLRKGTSPGHPTSVFFQNMLKTLLRLFRVSLDL